MTVQTKPDDVTEFALLGKTLASATRTDDELELVTTTGERWRFHHYQDCCESVTIESIDGSLDDLIGSPLVMAEETVRRPLDDARGETETWTFYRFATVKGYVTVRWHGTSNGYYSEEVTVSPVDANGNCICWRCGGATRGNVAWLCSSAKCVSWRAAQ